MKKFIFIIVALVLVLSACGGATCKTICSVVEVEGNVVTIMDNGDELWEFYSTANFLTGEEVEVEFDDNGTPDWIYDDCIVSVKLATH